MGKLRLGLAAAAVAIIGVASADQITIPNQFTAGTTARAAEVNENFDALAQESNAQDMRLNALESGSASTEQLICAAFVSGSPSAWPGDPNAIGSCVSSSAPTVNSRPMFSTLLSDGWKVVSVGGQTKDVMLIVFERTIP